jgi:hypothetical protein
VSDSEDEDEGFPSNEFVDWLGPPTPPTTRGRAWSDERANAPAAEPSAADVIIFEGYLRGSAGEGREHWVVLYRDLELERWLVVEETSIRGRAQIQDPGWPRHVRDRIWVYKDAVVGTGRGPVTTETMFLLGEFTRAGNVEAAPAGGTLPPASDGVFCPRSPNCCPYRSRTPPGGCRG